MRLTHGKRALIVATLAGDLTRPREERAALWDVAAEHLSLQEQRDQMAKDAREIRADARLLAPELMPMVRAALRAAGRRLQELQEING